MAKQFIPVANKPILGYVLDQVAETGVKEVGLVIAPETGHSVREYVRDGSEWGFQVTYIRQEPLGLAHAVKIAKNFLGEDEFVMCLGDNLQGERVVGFSRRLRQQDLDALILLKEVEDPTRFGVAVLDEKGNVVKLVEKSQRPPSNLAIVGTYFFSKNIHLAIQKIKPSWRGDALCMHALE